jgi:ribosomal protein L14E/L6E/L27E
MLRDTYATFRLMEGIDVYFLAKQMRTSVKMIEDYYGHINGGGGKEFRRREINLIYTAATSVTIAAKRGTAHISIVVSRLAQTDALTKLLIEKGLITREEFMQKISEERATYQRIFTQSQIR